MNKKNTTTSGKLIKALYGSYVCVYIFCTIQSGPLEYTSLFVGLGGWGLRGQRAENVSVRRWMRTGMGLMFREWCRWEVGVRLGWLLMTRRHLDWIIWSLR